jgi:DNA-binding CsgD family transcriptional regulator
VPVRGTRTAELFEIAEQLADLGCWELQLEDGSWVWSDGLFRVHGLEPRSAEPSLSLFFSTLHPDDREAVSTLVRTAIDQPRTVPADGVSAEYRIVRPDGIVRHVRAVGRVDTDESGSTTRWYGIAQDVTDQRQADRDLHAHYEVSQALRDWESFDEGIVGLLRRMGTALDVPVGALWTWGAGDVIVCRAFWHAPDVDVSAFADATLALRFRSGDALPGRVFRDAQPWFIPRLDDEPEFRRAEIARAAGLRSALVFPAVDAGEVIAALSFYSFDRREPSPRLERTLAGIGHQLGRFLSRRRAQLEPSPLSPRELEVLNLAAEGLSGPKIAERLVVSPSTVKTHFENIYEKLGVSDRGGAVAVGLRMGLIT